MHENEYVGTGIMPDAEEFSYGSVLQLNTTSEGWEEAKTAADGWLREGLCATNVEFHWLNYRLECIIQALGSIVDEAEDKCHGRSQKLMRSYFTPVNDLGKEVSSGSVPVSVSVVGVV